MTVASGGLSDRSGPRSGSRSLQGDHKRCPVQLKGDLLWTLHGGQILDEPADDQLCGVAVAVMTSRRRVGLLP